MTHNALIRFIGVSYDSTVHISEEASNARTAVPFSIIASAVVAGLVGWGKIREVSKEDELTFTRNKYCSCFQYGSRSRGHPFEPSRPAVGSSELRINTRTSMTYPFKDLLQQLRKARDSRTLVSYHCCTVHDGLWHCKRKFIRQKNS